MNELTSHTSFYLDRLPKSTKFTWQIKLVGLVQDAFIDVNRANAIKITTQKDYEERRLILQRVLECLASLDCFLSVLAQNDNYYAMITRDSENDYPWQHWGDLIDKEAKLIKGVLKKDKGLLEKLLSSQ